MIIVTLFMFFLSTTHIVMAMRYADIQFLEKDAARQGGKSLQQKGDVLVYVPILIEVITVSSHKFVVPQLDPFPRSFMWQTPLCFGERGCYGERLGGLLQCR
jgi:hypothetical protein